MIRTNYSPEKPLDTICRFSSEMRSVKGLDIPSATALINALVQEHRIAVGRHGEVSGNGDTFLPCQHWFFGGNVLNVAFSVAA